MMVKMKWHKIYFLSVVFGLVYSVSRRQEPEQESVAVIPDETIPVTDSPPIPALVIYEDDIPSDAGRDYVLRYCNAYPNALPLEMYINGIWTGSFPFKKCEDIPTKLIAGTKIQFTIKAHPAGEFQVANLPKKDGYLLLVTKRANSRGNAIGFLSHIFRPRATAWEHDEPGIAESQIVLIDAYTEADEEFSDAAFVQSGKNVEVYIEDALTSSTNELKHRRNAVPMNKVSEIQPGTYDVTMYEPMEDKLLDKRWVIGRGTPYVALRVGGLDELGLGEEADSDLLIYPETHPSVLDTLYMAWSPHGLSWGGLFWVFAFLVFCFLLFVLLVQTASAYSSKKRSGPASAPPTEQALAPPASNV